jgi:subtilisin family serine protease
MDTIGFESDPYRRSVHIVVPKEDVTDTSLCWTTATVNPDSRKARIDDLTLARANDPNFREIRAWLAAYEYQPHAVGRVSFNVPLVFRAWDPSSGGVARLEADPADTAAEAARAAVEMVTAGGAQTDQTEAPERGRVEIEQGASVPRPFRSLWVHEAPITGVLLVEMSHAQAAQMRDELPRILVLENVPMNIINPFRWLSRKKTRLAPQDIWHLRAIGLMAARERGFNATGDGVTVGLLDTGVDAQHPALGGKVSAAFNFRRDSNGWIADETASVDTDGHGTHVAGLICGETIGVAPGARITSGVAFPQGRGSLADFILAFEWIATRPEVQIANLSAGVPGYLPEVHEAIGKAQSVGLLTVCALGNEGRNRTRSPGNYSEVLSVGSAEERNGRYTVASHSSGGTIAAGHQIYEVPDLVAPGKHVYSSIRGGGFEAWTGTSMAAPIVSGIAALITERYPEIRVADLTDEILSTCVNLGLPASRQGRGMVQVEAAQ